MYAEKVLDLSTKVATEAAKQKVDKFVEVSTAQVYEAGKKPSKESSKTDPWTALAKFKLKAEEDLRKIAGLNLIIVRPAIVYGPGDINGLCTYIINYRPKYSYSFLFHDVFFYLYIILLCYYPCILRLAILLIFLYSPTYYLRCCIPTPQREDEVPLE